MSVHIRLFGRAAAIAHVLEERLLRHAARLRVGTLALLAGGAAYVAVTLRTLAFVLRDPAPAARRPFDAAA